MNETITKMRRFSPRRLSACRWTLVVFLVSLFLAETLALDLRVESKVYVDDDTQPFQHRIALFDEKATYDLAAVGRGRVTVLLRDQNTLTLIDTIKKEYTRISRVDLARHFTLQQERINKMPPERQAVINPSLNEDWNSRSKTLLLTSPHLTYSAHLTVKTQGIVKRYREFSDWHARLNAIMPGALSPVPRLALNNAVALRNAVPLEVTKTHVVDSKPAFRLRSEHRYEAKWRDDDRRRVKHLRETYPTYREVELDKFLRVATAAKTAGR